MKPVTIDFEALENRCRMDESEFFGFGEYFPVRRKGYVSKYTSWDKDLRKNVEKTYVQPDEDAFYLFKNNDARILAVAHLDTVVSVDTNWTFQRAVLGHNKAKREILWNAQLDDRLGVYILMDLLPKYLGKHAYDILLTTDEESSKSTAEDFVVPTGKDYNWIFQFDRRGTGAVLYGYDDFAWRETVDEFLEVEQGSFSDICKLYDLGVKGLNVGTGYHNEHQELCYMNVGETISQVTKFISFYRAHKDTKFPHDPTKSVGRWGNYSDYNDDDWWDGRGTSNYWRNRDTAFGAASTASNGGVRRTDSRAFNRPFTDDVDDDIDDDVAAEILHSMARYDDDGNYHTSDDSTDMNERVRHLQAATSEITKITNASLVPASDFTSTDPSSWVTLPATKRIICHFQYPEWCNVPTQVDVFESQITHNRAVYCRSCSIPVSLDEVSWTKDSNPICIDCEGLLPHGVSIYTKLPDIVSEVEDVGYEVKLTNDQLRWVQEGGGLRLGSKTIRTFTGVSFKENRCSCDFCLEAEWQDYLVDFTTPQEPDTTYRMCRNCLDIYQKEQEDQETKELPTPDTDTLNG